MHYQQGYVKSRGWAVQTQFVTDVLPHFRANVFSDHNNKDPPYFYILAHTETHLVQYSTSAPLQLS